MSIELEHLTKRYDGIAVVDGVSLAIKTGELFVLLGPSGSGKSTLLRMIAGLAQVDEGRVLLHGEDVTGVSPKDRGIGFVFQHYALFRNMDVAGNVEFALRVRRVQAAQRRRRREELLQLVGLSGFASRRPWQLSGGQQQRIALARALAHEPKVLLLDEPFGALDAKIRLELRQALRSIQRELGITTVFVTHDQEEAFELGDRLAVLHQGRLLEVGEPRELYLRPRSPFVATFLGAANLMVGESSQREISLGPVVLPGSSELVAYSTPRRVQILIRPEDVELSNGSHSRLPPLGRGLVEERAFVGASERLRLRLPLLPGVRAVVPEPPFGGSHFLVDVLRSQHESSDLPLAIGDEAVVAVRRFHVLAAASLRLLLDNAESAASRAARDLGEQLAVRLSAHCETLAGAAAPDFSAMEGEDLGAETERGGEAFDVAVLGLDAARPGKRLEGLSRLRHHLLLVPGPTLLPHKLLVCVAVGEPGKGDVKFAERFAWQLGASATVLTVVSEDAVDGPPPPHVERFLEACTQVLASRGVVARGRLRHGPVVREILAEIEAGGHDLVVVGAPLEELPGRSLVLAGIVEHLLEAPPPCPVLIVRRQL